MTNKKMSIDYNKIFDIANIGVYKTTPQGSILYANSYLAKMLGYNNVEELMMRRLEESRYYAPDYPRVKFKEAIDKYGYFIGQSVWRTQSGEDVYVMEFAVKNVDKNGNVCYEGVVENITSLIESYNKEKKLKEEWINLFNAVPDSVIILSEDQTILDANKATLELLNVSKNEILGKKCYRVFHQTDIAPDGCPFVEMMNKKNYSGFNEMVMDAVNRKYLVTVGLYNVRDSEKLVIHFAKDVTQIYDIREKLIKSLQRYNRILMLINNVGRIFMKEKNGDDLIKFTCENIASVEYFKGACIVLKDKEGMRIKASCDCDAKKIIKELKKDESIGKMFLGNNEILIFPMKIGNKILGYLGVVLLEDISDEETELLQTIANDMAFSINSIKLEQEREIAYEEMKKNLEDLMILVDGIRNPLAVIMGMAEIELDGEVKREIIKEIEKINRVTKRVDAVVKRSEKLQELLKR